MIMKLLNVLFRRQTTAPMLALSFASAVTGLLVVVRIIGTGKWFYACLMWNLFLAWLPMIFASLAAEHFQRRGGRDWRFLGLAGAWLLFFPNAPYIFTDLVHLTAKGHFWIDLTLFLLCGLTGFVLGFVSLYLMQTMVKRMYGRLASWLFIAGVAGLTSLGVSLGRFTRFNSWDVVVQPMKQFQTNGNFARDDTPRPDQGSFMLLFATFFFVAYVMLYTLTHLSPAQLAPARPQNV